MQVRLLPVPGSMVSAMGANVQIPCPVEGCDYKAGVRLGMGEETSSSAWGEWANTLREEHPNHPEPKAKQV
jgi:hypothetical protein